MRKYVIISLTNLRSREPLLADHKRKEKKEEIVLSNDYNQEELVFHIKIFFFPRPQFSWPNAGDGYRSLVVQGTKDDVGSCYRCASSFFSINLLSFASYPIVSGALMWTYIHHFVIYVVRLYDDDDGCCRLRLDWRSNRNWKFDKTASESVLFCTTTTTWYWNRSICACLAIVCPLSIESIAYCLLLGLLLPSKSTEEPIERGRHARCPTSFFHRRPLQSTCVISHQKTRESERERESR